MTKRWVRVVALLSVLAVVAAACGDDDGAESDGTEATEAPADGTEATEAPADGTEATEVTEAPAAETVVDRAACEGTNLTQGLTDTTIKIGVSRPATGVFAVFDEIRKGFEAYFSYANAELGGAAGRQIELVTRDDEYQTTKTVESVNQMLAQDEVFAFLNNIGTPNNLAIWDDLQEQCVPNLYVGTGHVGWGDTEHTFTVGSLPSYATEAAVFAEWLKENQPGAKVAILAQNDDFGFGYVDAFEIATEGSDIEIVEVQTYEASDPTVDTQITTMAASGADAALIAATSLACPNAAKSMQEAGWAPTAYISGTCIARVIISLAGDAFEGFMSGSYLMSPTDPINDADPRMVLYKEKAAQYGPDGIDLTDGLTVYGWTMGDLFVQTVNQVEARGLPLDRVSVAEVANTLGEIEAGLTLEGVAFRTSPGDRFPTETLSLYEYVPEATEFRPFGELIDFEGRTGEFIG